MARKREKNPTSAEQPEKLRTYSLGGGEETGSKKRGGDAPIRKECSWGKGRRTTKEHRSRELRNSGN